MSLDSALFACTQERGVAVFETRRGRLVHTLGAGEEQGARRLDAIVFSPDGVRLLATGGGELLEWSLPGREGEH